jgi:raffinose/stachyose/melibiose transport system permease protein
MTITEPTTTPTTSATPRRGKVGGRNHRTKMNPIGALGGIFWLIIVVVPLYWILITSLRSQQGFFASSPLALPTHPTLQNYRLVLDNSYFKYLLNSLIVTVGSVVLTLAVSLMAAYAVVRGTSRVLRGTFTLFLFGLAIPLQATIIPIYYLIVKMKLYDSLLALVLPSVAFAIPITVVILTNFLRDVPNELFESMHMDGAGEWRMLWSLALPLVRPAVTTVAIYDALQVWNGFLFPLILTQSPDLRVLPLALFSFQGQFTVNVPAILASVVLSTLPILALYIVGRRQLVSGLTAGFSK